MVELTHHLSPISSMLIVLMLAVGLAAGGLQESNTVEVRDSGNRSFSIDYDRDTFTMDGNPFRYVSGSLHYFRCPRRYWRDRLRTMRAAGINAVSTYVEWSFHEPEKGKYRWDGDQDLVRFIQLAQEEDLYVILRPGPYICAERDLGGFPYWLLSYYPNIILRTSDEDYKHEVEMWYGELMPLMQPLLYGNGGPIITVQVENEYGSYPACDKPYMVWLANLTRAWTADAAVLFTTDGASAKMLNCGATPGVYATVDFGTGTDMDNAWATMRKYSQKGPLVNSEFYPGWLSHWGEPIVRVTTAKVIQALVPMLDVGANVNFYMFYGGTNFDYTAGANIGDRYTPDLTSYDYDAPMTEAGDPTSKYTAIRNVLLNYTEMPTYPPPAVKAKDSLGPITLEPVLALMSTEGRSTFGGVPTNWREPPTQEALFQRSGLTLYERQLPDKRLDPAELSLPGLRDRALVYLDGKFVGSLSRTRKLFSLSILAAQGNYLQILVENQGRNNFGVVNNDFKGIKGNVTLNSVNLHHWKVTSFPLETVDSQLATSTVRSKTRSRFQVHEGWTATTRNFLSAGPVLYSAKFTLKEGEVLDTYLDVTGWSKGYAWVNDRHLGRYWPSEGPQVTLYTPGVYLNPYPLENTIVLLEFQRAPHNWTVSFVDHAIGV